MLTVKIPPFQNAQLKKKTLQFSVKLLIYFIEALIKPSNQPSKIKIGAIFIDCFEMDESASLMIWLKGCWLFNGAPK